jgi:hypothetical protein
MGRRLGRLAQVLTRRALLSAAPLTAAFVLAVLVVGAAPAPAADPTPAPGPTQVPKPSISPPSKQQIQDAKDALERLRNQGKSPATPTRLTQVAGPTAGGKTGSVAPRISDEAWWTIGAGLLLLVVVSETTRVSVRRAKHRKGA